MSAFLEVDKVSLQYDEQCVLNEVSFTLDQGEFGALLGVSGCGKTTLLRVIAGFSNVDHGSIVLSGACVSSDTVMLPAQDRNIGMVFQDYALFPHLTVLGNIMFGLPRGAKPEHVASIIDLLELSGLESRYPHQISGGQQQRVALARALAPKPHFILLDEPFSNLDVHLRERLAFDLRNLLKEQGITALLVTHDQNEAFAFADKIAVLHKGSIEQVGTAQELYKYPKTAFVANFIGDGTVFDCNQPLHKSYLHSIGVSSERIAEQDFCLLRPGEIVMNTHPQGLRVTLQSCLYRDGKFLCHTRLDDGLEVIFYHESDCVNLIGEYIYLYQK